MFHSFQGLWRKEEMCEGRIERNWPFLTELLTLLHICSLVHLNVRWQCLAFIIHLTLQRSYAKTVYKVRKRGRSQDLRRYARIWSHCIPKETSVHILLHILSKGCQEWCGGGDWKLVFSLAFISCMRRRGWGPWQSLEDIRALPQSAFQITEKFRARPPTLHLPHSFIPYILHISS